MLIKLKNWVDRFHGSESGAVLLLVLAAFLVLFMVAMTIFDSGKAAQDKMRVQVAADTAAYSHSVIKSRTMNVIVYANIIKRMFYSYFVTYVHAWIAILAEMVIKAAECADWVLTSCWDFVAALPMVIAEVIEAIENVKDLMLNGRASKEINQLDRYSAYMYAITPWWAWIEATGRSMGNGAMVSASWPPPPSSIGNIKNAVTTTSSTVDWALGTSFTAMMPSLSQATDALPVTRRDRQKVWEAKLEPFKFDWSQGAAAAGVGYCAEYAFSMELLLTSAQTTSSRRINLRDGRPSSQLHKYCRSSAALPRRSLIITTVIWTGASTRILVKTRINGCRRPRISRSPTSHELARWPTPADGRS